jgi:hypothetical protein
MGGVAMNCKDCSMKKLCVFAVDGNYCENFTALPSGIEALMCVDIAKRQELGIKKYGTTLADNPLELKEWLEHQYQELLDAALYCKRAIVQIENKESK